VKYLCMEPDADLLGRDKWEPIGVRNIDYPAKATDGLTRVMSVRELPTHHWNLRPGASKTLRNAAIKAYRPFLDETRAANPGVDVMQWAMTCVWTHELAKWNTEAYREFVVDHWVGVMKELELRTVCANVYDAVPNATPELGDPHAQYERDIANAKLWLARRVADGLGGECFATVWHHQRGIGPAALIAGRTLLRREILLMAEGLVTHAMDGVVFWHGDHSMAGCIANPAAFNKLDPAAVAATREQWAPEVFAPEETQVWDLSTLPRIHQAARRERLRFADTLLAATSN
jgi:hypothetical protein